MPAETFPQCCTRLIFEARDQLVKQGQRISPAVVERIIAEQQKAFGLVAAKPVLIDAVAEAIYQAYPRHEGKKTALRAISKAMRAIPSTQLMEKTMEYAKAVKAWPLSRRYTKAGTDTVPHPATWFNGERFNDDPKQWAGAPDGKSSDGTNGVNYSKF